MMKLLLFAAALASKDGLLTGKIVVKSKNSQFKVTIPYRAYVLQGRLSINETLTHFHLDGRPRNLEKNLTVTNEFSVPIVVYNVSLSTEQRHMFGMNRVNRMVIPPGKSATVAVLGITPRAWDGPNAETLVTFHTNVSEISMPLMAYNGKVRTVSEIWVKELSKVFDLATRAATGVVETKFCIRTKLTAIKCEPTYYFLATHASVQGH